MLLVQKQNKYIDMLNPKAVRIKDKITKLRLPTPEEVGSFGFNANVPTKLKQAPVDVENIYKNEEKPAAKKFDPKLADKLKADFSNDKSTGFYTKGEKAVANKKAAEKGYHEKQSFSKAKDGSLIAGTAKRYIDVAHRSDEDIDLDIKYNDLDNPNPYAYFSTIDDGLEEEPDTSTPAARIKKDKFVDDNYSVEELNALGINAKDFDGFLNAKGYKNNLIELIESGVVGGEGVNTFGGNDKGLSLELKKKQFLDAYINDANNRASKYTNLVNEKVNKGLRPDKHLKLDAKVSLVDQNKLLEYQSKYMPKVYNAIMERKKSEAEIYKKIVNKDQGAIDVLGDVLVSAGRGFLDTVNQYSTSLLEGIGMKDAAEETRLLNEERKLSRPDDRSVGYVSGKTVNFNGKDYTVDADGAIYDTENKLRISDLIDKESSDKIKEEAKVKGKDDSILSWTGSAKTTANTIGALIPQLALSKGVGMAGGKALADVGFKFGALEVEAPSIIAQGLIGASEGYESTLKAARESGISEAKARSLAMDASQRMAALYAVTAPISPNIKAKDAIFGNELKDITRQAIKGYIAGGEKAFAATIQKGFRQVMKSGVTFAEEGAKEAVQENVQQAAEIFWNNKLTNAEAGQEIKESKYSFDDFVNTTAISFATGGLISQMKLPSLSKADDKEKLVSLYRIGKDEKTLAANLKTIVDNGIATQEEADNLAKDAKAVYNNYNGIPSVVSDKAVLPISRKLQDITDLKNAKKRQNEAFHPDIDLQIETANAELEAMIKGDIINQSREIGSNVSKMADKLGIGGFYVANNSEEADAKAAELGLSMVDTDGQRVEALYDNGNIIIDFSMAGETLNINSSAHELLHHILAKTLNTQVPELDINGNPTGRVKEVASDAAIKLSNALDEHLNSIDPSLLSNDYMRKRLELYKGKSDTVRAEEKLVIFADALANKAVKLDETAWTKIKDSIRRIFQDLGWKDIKFDDGDDILNFLKDYNNSVSKGKAGKALIKASASGVAIGKKIGDIKAVSGSTESKYSKSIDDKIEALELAMESGEIDFDDYEMRLKVLEKEKAKPTPAAPKKPTAETKTSGEEDSIKETIDKNKGSIASDKVQNIYNEKGVDGAFDIIKLFRPITMKIVNKRKDAPGFDEELLRDEIETGDGGLMSLIKTYKPSSGTPLAAYINKNLPLRAIAASKRILDQEFFKDSSEEKGLAATETADQTMTVQVAEKPKYANAIESGVLESDVLNSIKSKALLAIRTMKSRIDEKTSKNRTVSPVISEILAEMGSLADIDIKTALGGKADGVLRKNLLRNKRYILENMTTTWLMGKDNGTSVAGGIPQAIQKKVGGQWLSYPAWVGKKIDRESVSTQLAGRTAGHELARRLPNVFNNVSNEDFLDQFLDPNGNPIRGRKESLSKAMAEEISLDIINDDFANEGELFEAFAAKQGDVDASIVRDIAQEFYKQSERGTTKLSKSFTADTHALVRDREFLFLDNLKSNNWDIAKAISNTWSDEELGEKSKLNKSKLTNVVIKALSAQFIENEDSSASQAKALKTIRENSDKISFDYDAGIDLIGAIEQMIDDNLNFGRLRNPDGTLTEDGQKYFALQNGNLKNRISAAKASNNLSAEEKTAVVDSLIQDYISKNSILYRQNSGKFEKYLNNKVFWNNTLDNVLSSEEKKRWIPVKDNEKWYIKLNNVAVSPLKFDPTIIELKKGAAGNISVINTQATEHANHFINTVENFKTEGNIIGGLAWLNEQSKDLRTSLALLAKFSGYEPGVLEGNKIVWEHNPPRKEIADMTREYLLGNIGKDEFIKFIRGSKVYAVSTDFAKKVDEKFKSSSPKDGLRYQPAFDAGFSIIDVVESNANDTSKASKSLSVDFNKILEETRGVKANEQFSDITARVIGSGKGKYRFFVPPSAEDFAGLLYDFMGKGKAGEAHAKFFQDNLIRPYVKGVERMDNVRANIKEGYKALKAEYPAESKKLKSNVEGKDFTYDQAVRVYLWQTNGTDVPGLSAKEITVMSNTVKKDKKLREFADKLSIASGQLNGWVEPTAYWNVESIVSDLHNATEKIGRRNILKEFIDNSEEIFSTENLNKIEATLGTNYREALEDSLFRMKNGTNRSSGDKFSSAWTNWIANANGVIMFFNTRSAILQTIAATNYINWSDNNVLAAGKAFLNQPQYWKDFSMIFNSNKMKERREGLKADVNEAELANAVRGSKNKAKAALSYLLKVGYTPTQMADSFAIAAGGAPFYRNRVNTYLAQGLTQAEAESKAFEDFDNATEESQQSSDPSKLSQQQASTVGRLVLAFANTPMQYNRLMKKAFRDLINGRGDVKTHVSKILYYGAVQNIVFSALQNAMFASLFDDDDEEKDAKEKADKENKKVNDLLNGMADTILRGAGFYGAIASTAKNVVLRYIEEEEKGIKGDQTKTLVAAVGISPPLGSKAQKLYSAMQTKKFDADVIAKRGFGLTADGKLNPSPSYDVAGKLIAVATNFPADRVVDKVSNVAEALDARNKTWQRIALGLGWNSYSVGVVNEEDDLIKAEAKAVRKKESTEKAKATRKLKSLAKQEKEVRKLDSIANLPEDQIEAYYLNEEIKKQEEKVRKLDSIANLPEDKIEAYYAEKENKKRTAALKRKIKKQMMQ